MLDIIPVVLGIILLIRGRFTLAGRYVLPATGRMIGALLIAPTVLTFCASTVLTIPIALDRMQSSETAQITIDLNDPALVDMVNTLGSVQLMLLVIAVGLSAYLIWRSPTTPPQQTPAGFTPTGAAPWNSPRPLGAAPPARVPDILTVQEAAAYLRVSEEELLGLIDAGRLPAARMGGNNYRIARIAIEDFLNNAT